MDNFDTTARFSMQKVVEETGLSADNLRAWEDRYGLPEPQRSPAGHRLYSLRDIALVKWLLARKQEGVRPNRAAKLYKELLAQGQDPLAGQAPPQTAAPVGAGRVGDLRAAWVAACLRFDEAQGEAILAQAFAQFPPVNVLMGLLAEGLKEIGQGWLEGKVTVAQEHFASNLAVRKVNQLIAALPPAARRETILVACPPGENHHFPALLITYMVRQAGYQAIYLGPDLPQEELRSVIADSDIDFAILAGTRLATAPELAAMLRSVGAAGIPAGYGGYIYEQNPALRAHMPGIYLGAEPDQIPAKLPDLPRHAPQSETEAPAPLPFLPAFNAQSSQIETWMREALTGDQAQTETPLGDAIEGIIASVAAAARLGDLEMLEVEITWLQEHLKRHPDLHLSVGEFLETLGQAVQSNLGSAGEGLIQWLEQSTAVATQSSKPNQ